MQERDVIANIIFCPLCHKHHPYDKKCEVAPINQKLIEEIAGKLKNGINHDHRCFCGMAKCIPHGIGHDGCERFMTEPPDLTKATLFTYEQQRGYFQHPCGCWSRQQDSENSLSA